jgi:hypothetical protein
MCKNKSKVGERPSTSGPRFSPCNIDTGGDENDPSFIMVRGDDCSMFLHTKSASPENVTASD